MAQEDVYKLAGVLSVIIILIGVLIVSFSTLIMAIGIYFKDPPIVAFAGFITMIVGIYVMINGMGDIVDPLIRYGIGVILLGIGGYVGFRAGYEQFKND